MLARLVVEGDEGDQVAAVHHCMSNDREDHAAREVAEEEVGVVEFPLECAEVLEVLLSLENASMRIDQLPVVEADDGAEGEPPMTKLDVTQAMYNLGLIVLA